MPELPEVENVRRGLVNLVKGKEIQEIDILWPRLIDTDQDLHHWVLSLQGQTIENVLRRGKYLIFDLSDYYLISHLRMEGKYLFFSPSTNNIEPNKHSHVLFHFQDGSQLHYNDVRKFGRFQLIEKKDLDNYFINKKLGPEPNNEAFDFNQFYQGLQKIKKPIKPTLLEQKLVAGLGNIYVDEVLFRAKIHPLRMSNSLNCQEAQVLREAIIGVLSRATEAGGSTIRTYKNSLGEDGTYQEQLLVYGKNGQNCPICRHEISKIKVGGRGTHYCPICQKE